MITEDPRLVYILLVEDNPGDVRLTIEALKEGRVLNSLSVVSNGDDALHFLKRNPPYVQAVRPDLILMDLNLPKRSGRELLAVIKSDDSLKRIPVVVLTTSKDEEDILRTYNLNCNCYITKPVDFERFIAVIKSIENFWLTVVTLPNR
jgi:CheY-like chemotaxis protein